jgi:hypothetical protein
MSKPSAPSSYPNILSSVEKAEAKGTSFMSKKKKIKYIDRVVPLRDFLTKAPDIF